VATGWFGFRRYFGPNRSMLINLDWFGFFEKNWQLEPNQPDHSHVSLDWIIGSPNKKIRKNRKIIEKN